MRIYNLIVLFISAALILSSCSRKGTGAAAASVSALPEIVYDGAHNNLLIAPTLISNKVGLLLDERDKVLISQVTKKVLEFTFSGQSLEWNNVDSHHHGHIMSTKVYEDARGRYCREFSQSIIVAGKVHNAYANACRTPDGEWELAI